MLKDHHRAISQWRNDEPAAPAPGPKGPPAGPSKGVRRIVHKGRGGGGSQ